MSFDEGLDSFWPVKARQLLAQFETAPGSTALAVRLTCGLLA